MTKNNIVLLFLGIGAGCLALVALQVATDAKGFNLLGAGLCSWCVATFIDHLP